MSPLVKPGPGLGQSRPIPASLFGAPHLSPSTVDDMLRLILGLEDPIAPGGLIKPPRAFGVVKGPEMRSCRSRESGPECRSPPGARPFDAAELGRVFWDWECWSLCNCATLVDSAAICCVRAATEESEGVAAVADCDGGTKGEGWTGGSNGEKADCVGGREVERADLTSCESCVTWEESEERVDSVLAIREERARYIGEVSHSRSGSGGWDVSPLTKGGASVPAPMALTAEGVSVGGCRADQRRRVFVVRRVRYCTERFVLDGARDGFGQMAGTVDDRRRARTRCSEICMGIQCDSCSSPSMVDETRGRSPNQVATAQARSGSNRASTRLCFRSRS